MRLLFIHYDNESRNNPFPLGSTYVAAYAKANGYEDITYYSQDVYHYPEEHLTEYLKNNHFDVVSIGFVAGYFQHKKIKKICDAITCLEKRPFIVMGGHGPSPIPEYFLKHTGADAVMMGEAEIPFLNLVRALENHTSLHEVRGIAFRDGDVVTINERQLPIENLDDLPFPYIEPLPMEYYFKYPFGRSTDRVMFMSAQRGCAHVCNFCYRMEKGMRFRSVANVVEEIKKYKEKYNISFILFTDELFMAGKRRTLELCNGFLEANLNIRYLCCGRLDLATEEILDKMKESGCEYIDYGIEQYDDYALQMMNKKQNVEQIERAIKMTLDRGIHPLFNIIFGNLGDTKESIRKSIDFLHKYNDYEQLRVIRPVTPYPGSPLYDEAIKRGLLTGPEDFYEKHKNVELFTCNFTSLSEEEFYQLMYDLNCEIIDHYYDHFKEVQKANFRRVYFEKDYGYRGARH